MSIPGVSDKPSLIVKFLKALPIGLAFALVKFYIFVFIRPKIKGLENLNNLKGPVILLSNRTSLIDVAIMVAICPFQLTVAIDEEWAKSFWVKVLSTNARIIPLNEKTPLAIQGMEEAIERGDVILMFPEAGFTTHGWNMKVSDVMGFFIMESKLKLLPVIFDGTQYTRFGQTRHFVRNAPKNPPVRVTIFPPMDPDFPERKSEKTSERYRRAATAVYGIFHEKRFWAKDFHKNLWTALTYAAKLYGKNRLILEDVDRKPMTYGEIVRDSKRYAEHFKKLSSPGENVGIILPNCIYNVLSLFGLWSSGRVPVILNYTQGGTLVNTAIKTALVKTVFTSRRFIAESGLDKLISQLDAKIIYIEDLVFSSGLKFRAFLSKAAPSGSEDPGVIVFTSGSEGKPKGVQHSHRSLYSNNFQTTCHLDYSEDDILFDPMPMFHTIGLNMLMLMPLLQGMYTFLYVSPLHSRNIPKLFYELGVTMVVASDTFANAWAREGHPQDFSSLRILLCGSERIKEKTHKKFLNEFGVRIYEGYGVSEAAPVTCVSSQMNYRLGACGNFLPGIETKLTPVQGVENGGVLNIKGPNIMMGYLLADNPGVLVPPPEGWHNTGDIVEVDRDKFVWIKGRFKRFAKIGGEMLSLVAIEEVVNQLWPGRPQAVMAVSDEKKGERLILVTEEENPDLIKLREALKEAGFPDIAAVRQFVRMEKVPLNPVGKLNFPQIQEELNAYLAKEAMEKTGS
jgi:acyl-[acyl-carrier-protein]-phospholipid O-acyltransferase/long-chain-fatty-acid--[acyl-carrier-protein] ligase